MATGCRFVIEAGHLLVFAGNCAGATKWSEFVRLPFVTFMSVQNWWTGAWMPCHQRIHKLRPKKRAILGNAQRTAAHLNDKRSSNFYWKYNHFSAIKFLFWHEITQLWVCSFKITKEQLMSSKLFHLYLYISLSIYVLISPLQSLLFDSLPNFY